MSTHHTKEITIGQRTEDSGAFLLMKKKGETLAVLLENFRREMNFGPEIKMTYAGRLDPMAEGLVVVLVGESRFHKDELLGLSKVYEMEVLLGINTDTQDVLGMITETKFAEHKKDLIRTVVNDMKSISSLPYPKYSSVPVEGKPLFVHARAGNNVKIPEKKVFISEVELLDIRTEKINDIAENAIKDIEKVIGDFRQEEIIKCWQELLDQKTDVVVVKIKASVSSGTYMRSLAKWLGGKLGTPAIAYSIKRTKIGSFD